MKIFFKKSYNKKVLDYANHIKFYNLPLLKMYLKYLDKLNDRFQDRLISASTCTKCGRVGLYVIHKHIGSNINYSIKPPYTSCSHCNDEREVNDDTRILIECECINLDPISAQVNYISSLVDKSDVIEIGSEKWQGWVEEKITHILNNPN